MVTTAAAVLEAASFRSRRSHGYAPGLHTPLHCEVYAHLRARSRLHVHQIRVLKSKHPAQLRSWKAVKVDQITVEYGFWVTAGNRREWIWPQWVKELPPYTVEAWQQVYNLIEWENMVVMPFDYKTELPKLMLQALADGTFGGTKPTKTSYGSLWPSCDDIEANCMQLLGPPPSPPATIITPPRSFDDDDCDDATRARRYYLRCAILREVGRAERRECAIGRALRRRALRRRALRLRRRAIRRRAIRRRAIRRAIRRALRIRRARRVFGRDYAR